jgi:hypothetical protein
MTRVPLLADARLVVAEPGPQDIVLRPPAQRDVLGDVGQAVRDALAFPLAGEPLERLVTRGGTATLVIEQPSLPIPGATLGPRHLAVAAAASELERLGVRHLTIVVAGGLLRRASPRDIGVLFPPEFRRRFRGRIIVHDAEADDLVELGEVDGVPLRVNRALVETDLVLPVTAAETVVDGGPGAFLNATGPESLRAAASPSLLEAGGSQGWKLALEVERRLQERVAVTGVSLVLNLPRIAGPFAGYPYDAEAVDKMLRSRVRWLFHLAPARVRQRVLDGLPRELTAAAAYGGTPSVAHTEALLRGTVFRGATLDEPLDAVVIGIPPTTPWMPRERPNPMSATYLGLGLALRLWRNAPIVADGGTAILMHPLPRRFPRPTQMPYRAVLFHGDEQAVRSDARALADYRAGHACHPLQPFVEWSACEAVRARLGAVLVAGCRDAQAARQLGLVPVHGLGVALEMARGRGARRIGYVVAPPYFPVTVGAS